MNNVKLLSLIVRPHADDIDKYVTEAVIAASRLGQTVSVTADRTLNAVIIEGFPWGIAPGSVKHPATVAAIKVDRDTYYVYKNRFGDSLNTIDSIQLQDLLVR